MNVRVVTELMRRRYDKLSLAISFIALLFTGAGIIVNYLQAKQATDSSNQAVSVAE